MSMYTAAARTRLAHPTQHLHYYLHRTKPAVSSVQHGCNQNYYGRKRRQDNISASIIPNYASLADIRTWHRSLPHHSFPKDKFESLCDLKYRSSHLQSILKRHASSVSFASQGFQGIPSAYKSYRDTKPDRRNNNKHSSNSLSPMDRSSAGSVSGTWTDKDGKKRSTTKDLNRNRRSDNNISLNRNIMKKLQRLDQLQNELKEHKVRYYELLGTDILCSEEMKVMPLSQKDSHDKSVAINNTKENGMDVHCLEKNLLETEEIYRNTCILLRQIVAGWSWIKPMPRWIADEWRSDKERNPLPPTNALKYLNMLEDIRKRREDLIKYCLEEKEKQRDGKYQDSWSQESSGKIVQWLTETFSKRTGDKKGGGSIPSDDLNEVSSLKLNLGNLTAHISNDLTANVRLYDAVLNCFCQWFPVGVKDEEQSIECILSTMKYNYERGNTNSNPDLKIYHRMIEYYKNSETLLDAVKGAELLKEMIIRSEKDANGDIDLGRNGSKIEVASCSPTIDTFTLVVSAFHGIGSTMEVKVQALDAADEVLQLMEKFYRSRALFINAGAEALPEDTTSVRLALCDPYRAMLQNLMAVGPKELTDYHLRLNSIMERLMGKDFYEKLLTDHSFHIFETNVDHLILHDLIHALAITNDMNHIHKAKIVLQKMEAARDDVLAQTGATSRSKRDWPPTYPTANSYKSIIHGILHASIDVDDETSVRKVASVDDALYATRLLDTIITTKPSLSNVYSCYRVIRLWGATNSEVAGRKGEEILGKMIMGLLVQKDRHVVKDLVLRAKQSTLENWYVSASAGAPGAAFCAYNLLERMRDRLREDDMDDEKRRKEMTYFYTAVIRACAETRLEIDKEVALDIAFQTYNEMIEENATMTPYLFVHLMRCCQLASSSSHDKALRLSKEVFQAACKNGLVNRHVLYVLKQVNYHLFESYEKKPEHSANVKKMIPFDD